MGIVAPGLKMDTGEAHFASLGASLQETRESKYSILNLVGMYCLTVGNRNSVVILSADLQVGKRTAYLQVMPAI